MPPKTQFKVADWASAVQWQPQPASHSQRSSNASDAALTTRKEANGVEETDPPPNGKNHQEQKLHGRVSSTLTIVVAAGLLVGVAVSIHWEGVHHRFAFDDSFAITNNQDVLGNTPWKSLLTHDFWGADITKKSANKSYRPFTVGFWRLLHAYTRNEDNKDEPVSWWFHFVNIALHSVVSIQVFSLARQLAGIFGYDRPSLRAFVAAMLFATHPVHVEVVIGCVGVAEILCASLGLGALQLLLCDDESFMRPSALLRTLLGFCLMFLATLSKEIGITLCGTLALWDGMVIPFLRDARVALKRAPRAPAISKAEAWLRGPEAPPPPPVEPPLTEEDKRKNILLRVFLGLRIVLSAACVFGYKYGLRVRVSGGIGKDLVLPFRRQENPFFFAPDRQVLTLSIMYNHASYAWLLLFPRYLSADWSYACTDYVNDFHDVRNAGSGLLYLFLLIVLLRSRPWVIAGRALNLTQKFISNAMSIEQAFLVYGLLVIPFMPASNIFFYVGTAMGERLLYFPSLGYVLFVAHIITGSSRSAGTVTWKKLHRGFILGRFLVFATLVAAYVYRTLDRVPDWKTEEYLFEKAYEVCPNSGKVLQNMGIVMQHEKRYDRALELFRTAHDIDPSCCDFSFFVSQTLLMQGKFEEGLPGIHTAAVVCKTERQKALEILGQVLQQNREGPFEAAPEKIKTQQTVGLALLQDDETGDPAHGCALLESSMWSRVGSTHPWNDAVVGKHLEQEAKTYMQRCFEFTAEMCEKQFKLTKPNVTPAAKCIRGRVAMAQATARYGRKSEQLYAAAYKYIKLSRELGCAVNPSFERMDELCGAKRVRLARASYSRLAKAQIELASDPTAIAGASGVSDGHRTAIHIVQSDDPMNPWFHFAWAEVLILEGRIGEGAKHLNVGGSQLATAVQEMRQRQQNGGRAKKSTGELDYTPYLRTPMAATEDDIVRIVQNVTAEIQDIELQLGAMQTTEEELRIGSERRKAKAPSPPKSRKGGEPMTITREVPLPDARPSPGVGGKGSGGTRSVTVTTSPPSSGSVADSSSRKARKPTRKKRKGGSDKDSEL